MHCCILRLALLGLTLGSSACISGTYGRNHRNQPLLERAQAEPPQSGWRLDQCLESLGAPSGVFEYQVHGLLLVYAWDHQRQWIANFSIPAGDSASASFNVSNLRRNQEGLVLWLDANWELMKWEHGYVRSLIGDEPRPATLEQLEAP